MYPIVIATYELTYQQLLGVTAIIAILASATVASIFGYAALSNTSQFVYAQKQGQSFHAKLTGKDEVPSKNTKSTGTADFTVTGAASMRYKVSVTEWKRLLLLIYTKVTRGK